MRYDELVELIGQSLSQRRLGGDAMEYLIEVDVGWQIDPDGDIAVVGSISPADWGSPHDLLCECLVVCRVIT